MGSMEWLLPAGAAINVIFGTYSLVRSVYRQERWKSADGRIIDLQEVPNGDAYAPVVRFRTPPGTEHIFKNRLAMHGGHYQVGYSMKVLYDPDNPDRAMIDDGFTLWGGATIGLGAGTVFGVLAWLLW